MKVVRLRAEDGVLARELFLVMAEVFAEDYEELGEDYVDELLRRESFWAFAAVADGVVVGGLTAHVLPMTRAETSEIFIYDIAVRAEYQRQGVGRSLVAELRRAAAAAKIGDIFVPADNDDVHALDFYRSLGGEAAAVTFFTFARSGFREGVESA